MRVSDFWTALPRSQQDNDEQSKDGGKSCPQISRMNADFGKDILPQSHRSQRNKEHELRLRANFFRRRMPGSSFVTRLFQNLIPLTTIPLTKFLLRSTCALAWRVRRLPSQFAPLRNARRALTRDSVRDCASALALLRPSKFIEIRTFPKTPAPCRSQQCVLDLGVPLLDAMSV